MDDLATVIAGASVVMATCADERHPAEAILAGGAETSEQPRECRTDLHARRFQGGRCSRRADSVVGS